MKPAKTGTFLAAIFGWFYVSINIMEILNKYHPKYFIHGHVHMNYGNYPRFSKYEDTIVINAFERFVIEVPLPEKDERKRPEK